MYKIFKVKEDECSKIVNNLTSVLDFANKICSKCCDIQKLETRIEILKKKAKDEQIEIPEDVIEFIASQIQTNSIDLFSALFRISAFIKFTDSPFTVDVVQKAFKDFKFEEESHCKTCQYNTMKNSISDVINIIKRNQIKN
jgi:chromosomal replication initiation ATPase DnaA